MFTINFTGESGIDAGGVFREGVSRIVEDLFSEHLNLFLLCPNGQHETFLNCDKFVPNPMHSGPLAIQMFEFVGRLMAMSLRVKLCLPFELPSIVWKKFVGEQVTFEDLTAIDAITCSLLDAIRKCEQDGVCDEEAFTAKYGDKLRWVYTGSDGGVKALVRRNSSSTTSSSSSSIASLASLSSGSSSVVTFETSKGAEGTIMSRGIVSPSW